MQSSAKMLREKGLRPSLQRVQVLHYLLGVKTHPTVDEIYSALLPECPSLSRTTVYSTLELLCANHLALALDFGEGFLRYDADCSPHCHFLCDKCKRVYDVFVPPPDYSKLVPQGFLVTGTALYMFGCCRECSAEE